MRIKRPAPEQMIKKSRNADAMLAVGLFRVR
ncbi:MAG: hypothetical protein KatS3mg111_0356 [Pirellulaceae bacterium]|nr:MAG: hypothetical protein KatS3mg111_0356 [Pirellulaceae bacterium]